MAERKNRFANIDDPYWLDLNFYALVSPESLHRNGERSPEAAAQEFSSIRAEYCERLQQLAA